MADPKAETRPERILDLTARLHAVAGVKIGEITTVNRQAKMLSMNAMVVAARAGDAGKSFAVVPMSSRSCRRRSMSSRLPWKVRFAPTSKN